MGAVNAGDIKAELGITDGEEEAFDHMTGLFSKVAVRNFISKHEFTIDNILGDGSLIASPQSIKEVFTASVKDTPEQIKKSSFCELIPDMEKMFESLSDDQMKRLFNRCLEEEYRDISTESFPQM